MPLSCSYIPRNKKGEELKGFQTYRKELGYHTAAKVFTQVLSPSFQQDYRDRLELDSQGVPTYQSVVKVPYIKNLIVRVLLLTQVIMEEIFRGNKLGRVYEGTSNYFHI